MNLHFKHSHKLWIAFLSLFILQASFAIAAQNGQVTIVVTGMSCNGCEARIRATLKALPGVIAADANYKKETAFVEYDASKITPAALVKAITDMGYGAHL